MGAFLPTLLDNEILAGGVGGTVKGLKGEIEKLTPSAGFTGGIHLLRYGDLRILTFNVSGKFPTAEQKTITTLDAKDAPPVDMQQDVIFGSLNPLLLNNKGICGAYQDGKINVWYWGTGDSSATFSCRGTFPWIVIDGEEEA